MHFSIVNRSLVHDSAIFRAQNQVNQRVGQDEVGNVWKANSNRGGVVHSVGLLKEGRNFKSGRNWSVFKEQWEGRNQRWTC